MSNLSPLMLTIIGGVVCGIIGAVLGAVLNPIGHALVTRCLPSLVAQSRPTLATMPRRKGGR